MERRKEIELEERKKRERELKELEMKCDICYLSHFNAVLVLKPNKFSKYASKKEAKARRVCWGCAQWLFKNGLYNFGTNWRNLFFYQMGISKTNRKKYKEKREKYMVIHA